MYFCIIPFESQSYEINKRATYVEKRALAKSSLFLGVNKSILFFVHLKLTQTLKQFLDLHT